LRQLQELEDLEPFLLVGGTSLALQIGHRKSIDLDFFADNKKYQIDLEAIPEIVKDLGKVDVFHKRKSLLQMFLNDVKVDFVSYRYEFIENPLYEDGLKLASIPDIGAMKLSAITGRGSKKDFIDLYFLLRIYTIAELFDFHRKKYPDSADFMVYKSLTYFVDADAEDMPEMLESVEWGNNQKYRQRSGEWYVALIQPTPKPHIFIRRIAFLIQLSPSRHFDSKKSTQHVTAPPTA